MTFADAPGTPDFLTAAITQQVQVAQDAAAALADAWDSWATHLDELARTMPELPTALSVLNHHGRATTITPALAADIRDLMTERLLRYRDQADAYAATVRRTFAQLSDDATSSLCLLGQWSQQRYVPIVQRGSIEGYYQVVDTGPDGDGFWLYETDDEPGGPPYFEDADAAAELAGTLNRNPEPFPEAAPRGRYIPWRSRYVIQVIDRGEKLDEWQSAGTVATWQEAVDKAALYAAGELEPPVPSPVDQEVPW